MQSGMNHKQRGSMKKTLKNFEKWFTFIKFSSIINVGVADSIKAKPSKLP